MEFFSTLDRMKTHVFRSFVILGTAPFEQVRRCLADLRKTCPSARLVLLAPERDHSLFYDADEIHVFQGRISWHNRTLLRRMLCRPSELVVACGLHYDHDNVLVALDVWAGLLCFRPRTLLHLRGALFPARAAEPARALSALVRLLPLSLAAALVLLLRPWHTVRVGRIYAERIGHLALDCEIALSQRALGLVPPRSLDLYYVKDNRVSNPALLRLFARRMCIHPWCAWIDEAVRLFGLGERHLHVMNTHRIRYTRDVECVMQRSTQLPRLTVAEDLQGQRRMAELGLNPRRPHVCLLGRDSAYLGSLAGQSGLPNNKDDNRHRNMRIERMVPAIRALSAAGLQTLRMGSVVSEPLTVDVPGFLDYAGQEVGDPFLDVYLAARCHFFLGVPSGLVHVAEIFRRPLATVNLVRVELVPTCDPRNLTIFKLIRSRSLGRVLTLDEMLAAGLGRCPIERFNDLDLELVENTSEEICELVREMLARLDGTWEDTGAEETLQQAFWRRFRPDELNSCFHSRIGAAFLRRHAMTLGLAREA